MTIDQVAPVDAPAFDTKPLMTQQFMKWAKERRAEMERERSISDLAHAGVARMLAADCDTANDLGALVSQTQPPPFEVAEPVATAWSRDRVISLTDSCRITDLSITRDNTVGSAVGNSIGIAPADKDSKFSVFTAPFADQWAHSEGDHQQMMAAADKSSGFLQVLCTIGQEGGSAFAGAGVAIFFTRDIPGDPAGQGPPGLAHVLTYTPYDYRWRNLSYLGTAHQRGGFGVRVFSQDYDGGPVRVDQDYSHWSWSDGSSWYGDHHNGRMPGMDHDYALEGTDKAPYFSVEPNRWYQAWIWCFISGDAHGASTFSAAYAQAQIAATVQTIVVGQT